MEIRCKWEKTLTGATEVVTEDRSPVGCKGVTETADWLSDENLTCPSDETFGGCNWDIDWYWFESLKLLGIWP